MASKAEPKPPLAIHLSHTSEHGYKLEEKLRGDALTDYAQTGVSAQHKMTITDALRDYPWALFWCLMVSMCVIMEGYDTILMGNFYAYP